MATSRLIQWARSRAGQLRRVADAPVAQSEADEVVDEPVEVATVMPWHAAAQVADEVGSVLSTLDIDYWTVNPLLATRITIWAIRERDWRDLVAALATRLDGQGYNLASREKVVPLDAGLSLDELDSPSKVTLFRPVVDRGPEWVSNRAAACEIQLWTSTSRGTLRTAEKSGVIHEIPDRGRISTVLKPRWDSARVPRPAANGAPGSEIDFEVDAVYTWVDDRDSAWRSRRDHTLAEPGPDRPRMVLCSQSLP